MLFPDHDNEMLAALAKLEQRMAEALEYPHKCDLDPDAKPEDGYEIGEKVLADLQTEICGKYEARTELLRLIGRTMHDAIENGRPLSRNEMGLIYINCEQLAGPIPRN